LKCAGDSSGDTERFRENVLAAGTRFLAVSDLESVKSYLVRLVEETQSKLVVCDKRVSKLISPAASSMPFHIISQTSVSRSEFFRLLKIADIGISLADLAVADTGTLVFATDDETDRLVTALPGVHVAIVSANCLVRSLDEAGEFVERSLTKNRAVVISLISASSRTSDIGDIVILGVHGPKQLHIILFDGSLSTEA